MLTDWGLLKSLGRGCNGGRGKLALKDVDVNQEVSTHVIRISWKLRFSAIIIWWLDPAGPEGFS